jgi:2,6-dihydroxypseudooxynicotine hydrolase
MHEKQAVEARDRGHQRTAGEAFLQAAICHHFAKFVWTLDPARNRAETQAAVRTLYAAHALLDPSAERIEAEGAVANLRRPHGDEPAPLVVLIPGLDSTKEEFFRWESVFLDRGLATLSVDGPGQGETGVHTTIRPDYEVAVTAVLDALVGRTDLDLERVGAAGVSLGGYYVVRAAAFEPRLTAIAGVSGPFDAAAQWDSMPSLTREAFTHHTGAADEAEARARAGALNLDGVAERVAQPCLVVTGKRDRVIPWEQTERIARAVPKAEWVLYQEGTHVCNNIPFKYRPLVADWMADQLRGQPA